MFVPRRQQLISATLCAADEEVFKRQEHQKRFLASAQRMRRAKYACRTAGEVAKLQRTKQRARVDLEFSTSLSALRLIGVD